LPRKAFNEPFYVIVKGDRNNSGARDHPLVGELDELETFVGSKKTKSGCGQQ
jgi:hypothetical protein